MEAIPEHLRIEFNKAKTAFMEAENICIISHRSPDGDAVGSNLALKKGLETFGKKVVSASVDPVPFNSSYLPGAEDFVTDFVYEDFDLIVAVDCGALKLVVFHEKKPEILSGGKPFINFDHHESNDNYGKINPVDPKAAATCSIIYKFFQFCGWKITIEIATCLLHGLYFDTGGMMHSNTTSEELRIASALMSKGANVQKIARELFHTTPVNKLRLWGRILERAYINDDGVTVSAVGRDDFEACGASPKDSSGVIDYLNSVPDSKYCVLLSEDPSGIVKGSLRTQRNDVNLSEVASKWGGGGHPKASGFGVEGSLKPNMTWKIVPENGTDAHGTELVF